MLTISILTGCSKVEDKDDVAINLFDMQKANNIVKDYLNNVISGNFDAANNLLSEELVRT